MLKFDDFKKLAKSQVLNNRFIVGGGVATEYYKRDGTRLGDDYKYNDGCVSYSGHVTRGGTEKADPHNC